MNDQSWLETALATVGAISGTVHRVVGDHLELTASVGIPAPVVALTRHIPKGKGMAGLAWARGHAVETCNLEADETGDVRPGAKTVDALAAIAIPIPQHNARAVVGFAFAGNELPDGLSTCAESLPD